MEPKEDNISEFKLQSHPIMPREEPDTDKRRSLVNTDQPVKISSAVVQPITSDLGPTLNVKGYSPLLSNPGVARSAPSLIPESTAWAVYTNEAGTVDAELVNDWTTSLNSLLVFVSLVISALK